MGRWGRGGEGGGRSPPPPARAGRGGAADPVRAAGALKLQGLARSKGLNTLCVLSAQSRTRSADIALLRSLKQCSADREYTY